MLMPDQRTAAMPIKVETDGIPHGPHGLRKDLKKDLAFIKRYGYTVHNNAITL